MSATFKSTQVPQYCHHRASGQAVVRFNGHDYYLGKFGSPESHDEYDRLVAFKVLSRQVAATSPPRKRFLREARAVAAIKHENVVQVYSVEEQPLPYLVMEFVDGATLQESTGVGHPRPAPGPGSVRLR